MRGRGFRKTELEALAGAGLAILLALALARVAGEQAFSLERGTKGDVHGEQRAGDAVTDGTSLAIRAATLHVDADVKLADGVGDFQGLHDGSALVLGEEVFLHRATIDDDFARTDSETNAGYCGLAASGSEVFLSGGHVVVGALKVGNDYFLISSLAGVWAEWGCLSPA